MHFRELLRFFDQPTIGRLAAAMALGCLIGAERQWRQRAAGLRTNALVCFGAATFVDVLSGLSGNGPTAPSDLSRVIGQVVTGVGFLGAGAILKEGLSIRGLNTAATLWCSAAIGCCAGAGQLIYATYATAFLLAINLTLRPISRWVDVQSMKGLRRVGPTPYQIRVRCAPDDETAVRMMLVEAVAGHHMILRDLHSEVDREAGEVSISADVETLSPNDAMIEGIVAALRNDPSVTSLEWVHAISERE